LPLGPSDERVAGVRVNSGGRLVVALLHSPSDGSAGSAVTALRFTGRGDVDVTYGCAGVKSGPLRIGSLVPQAGAFNAEGSALFVARESGSSDYESVVRTSGLPELGAGGASGEEIAHGCPSNEVLTHNLGGGRMPLGLLALCAVAALRRGLRRR
jgi:hypothetical protein